LFDGFDIYIYEYASPAMSRSYSPDEIAENMRLFFESDKILQHDRVVFLAHSLGGIVTRAYLTKYRRAAQRVAFIYFFSTPTTGSEIAALGALVSKNPQFGTLRTMESTDYLADLQRQWLAADFKFPSYCAYEVQKTYGQAVVTQASATGLCNRRLDPIDANHIDIVKPADTRSPSYLAFRAAFAESGVTAGEGASRTKRKARPASRLLPPAKENPPKLLDLFNEDFANVGGVTDGGLDLSYSDGGTVHIERRILLDFPEKNEFVAFYVPATVHEFEACLALADAVRPMISSLPQRVEVTGGDAGGVTKLRDLNFSGQVFLYHEWPLTNKQKADVIEAYSSKGLDVQFRGIDYLLTRFPDSRKRDGVNAAH
jgi:pimeloyl-ACP methyl ester carboxylesterase